MPTPLSSSTVPSTTFEPHRRRPRPPHDPGVMSPRAGGIAVSSRRARLIHGGTLAGVALLALTACGGPGGGGTAQTGNTVTIATSIGGEEATQLERSWAGWAKENNITIKLRTDKGFEQRIQSQVQANKTPDLAIFAQPGLLADLAQKKALVPAPPPVQTALKKNYSADWQRYGTVDGTAYGVPILATVKGFIWYSPSLFRERGWEVPDSWQGLLDLTAKVRADTSSPPWCAGFAAGGASGWPGSDWIEDVVLRQSGPRVYDDWVDNKIPFSDPRIRAAFTETGKILLNPDYVNAGFGGPGSINTTGYGDEIAASIKAGTCVLIHQASFFDTFAQSAGLTVGPDADLWAFPTPAFSSAAGNAVTGAGDTVAAFNNREPTAKVLEYLASPEWANARVALGGVISPNNGLDPSVASSPILTESIRVLQDPDTIFRFDASDLMPAAVGTTGFLSGITDWIDGASVEVVTTKIDTSWPAKN